MTPEGRAPVDGTTNSPKIFSDLPVPSAEEERARATLDQLGLGMTGAIRQPCSIDVTLNLVYDENLVGLWDSGPYDNGAMESSWLGFLPDGRGWSAWANVGGEIDVGRFRWHCPEPATLELRYEWQVSGEWSGARDPLRFSSIDSRLPDNEVLSAGYAIMLDKIYADEFTALHLAKHVQYCSTYALVQRALSLEDDPAHHLAPWR